MFVRIGMLAWWLGAIVLALVLAGTGYNYYEHMNCPWTMAAHDKNTKAREAVEAAYAQAHPTTLCVGLDIESDRIERATRKQQRANNPTLPHVRAP